MYKTIAALAIGAISTGGLAASQLPGESKYEFKEWQTLECLATEENSCIDDGYEEFSYPISVKEVELLNHKKISQDAFLNAQKLIVTVSSERLDSLKVADCSEVIKPISRRMRGIGINVFTKANCQGKKNDGLAGSKAQFGNERKSTWREVEMVHFPTVAINTPIDAIMMGYSFSEVEFDDYDQLPMREIDYNVPRAMDYDDAVDFCYSLGLSGSCHFTGGYTESGYTEIKVHVKMTPIAAIMSGHDFSILDYELEHEVHYKVPSAMDFSDAADYCDRMDVGDCFGHNPDQYLFSIHPKAISYTHRRYNKITATPEIMSFNGSGEYNIHYNSSLSRVIERRKVDYQLSLSKRIERHRVGRPSLAEWSVLSEERIPFLVGGFFNYSWVMNLRTQSNLDLNSYLTIGCSEKSFEFKLNDAGELETVLNQDDEGFYDLLSCNNTTASFKGVAYSGQDKDVALTLDIGKVVEADQLVLWQRYSDHLTSNLNGAFVSYKSMVEATDGQSNVTVGAWNVINNWGSALKSSTQKYLVDVYGNRYAKDSNGQYLTDVNGQRIPSPTYDMNKYRAYLAELNKLYESKFISSIGLTVSFFKPLDQRDDLPSFWKEYQRSNHWKAGGGLKRYLVGVNLYSELSKPDNQNLQAYLQSVLSDFRAQLDAQLSIVDRFFATYEKAKAENVRDIEQLDLSELNEVRNSVSGSQTARFDASSRAAYRY